ncbi:EamA family transporter [Azospirillum melinis]|uniref:EamA family transporter n=1 Tax=Azospirillum melinis TaxID=328839 RepID=A0ABX2KHC7_9PROT|nr:DMT family transporter [Azospirillum melinis]MBP2307601.1 drug/metabolite transporter (DMT)-like permease [Azospirillum melinis]NUB00055.1 EamA family transporter [Azospirillum melinis]
MPGQTPDPSAGSHADSVPDPSPVPSSSGNSAGIMLRLVSAGLFVVMSLFVRLASAEAPVGQIVFFRSAFAIPPIVAYLMWRRQFPSALRTRQPVGHLKRNFYGGMAMVLSFVSLAYLPLALATALGFLAPLLAVPAAMLFLRERPGAVAIGAALIGFAGVLLMLVPAFEGPTPDHGTLIGVAAGLAMAFATAAGRVQIKTLTATEAPGTIAFYFALLCALGGLASWPFGWVTPSGFSLACLIGAGVSGGLAHITMTEAMARASVSTQAPFDYTAMLWALILDAAIFGVLPSPVSLAGAFVIAASALVIPLAGRFHARSAALDPAR